MDGPPGAGTPHHRRVPGFDLTFSVPKSVSMPWALGDPRVQGEVVDAAESALAEMVTASTAWLTFSHPQHAAVHSDVLISVWAVRTVDGDKSLALRRS